MSVTAEDRVKIHRYIDEIMDFEGLEGFFFKMAFYVPDDVKTFQYGQGNIPADDQIRTDMRMLVAQCRKLGTPRALFMIPWIEHCIRVLEMLYERDYGEGTEVAGHA